MTKKGTFLGRREAKLLVVLLFKILNLLNSITGVYYGYSFKWLYRDSLSKKVCELSSVPLTGKPPIGGQEITVSYKEIWQARNLMYPLYIY